MIHSHNIDVSCIVRLLCILIILSRRRSLSPERVDGGDSLPQWSWFGLGMRIRQLLYVVSLLRRSRRERFEAFVLKASERTSSEGGVRIGGILSRSAILSASRAEGVTFKIR